MHSKPEFSAELELAKKLAVSAGGILLKHYEKVLAGDYGFEVKGPRDFITRADKDSEEHIVSAVNEAFPEHSIAAEEGSLKEAGSTKWLIDPLDGTDNFIAGFPWFAVSIGVEKEGVLFCGVVCNPVTRELYYAEKGKGAYLNGQRITAGTGNKYPDVFVLFQMSKKKAEKRVQGLKFYNFYFERALRAQNHDCMPLDFCKVAAGKADLFIGNGGWPWDFAAGILIASEAGAVVSDPFGGELDIYLRGEKAGYVVAANTEIHSQAIADVKGFW